MDTVIEQRPPFSPFGGRRGAMYLADFRSVVERARYRPDWRWHHRRYKMRHQGIPEHLVSVQVNDAMASYELDPWGNHPPRQYRGVVGNVKHGMIPEWDHVYEDIDKGMFCRGWKPLLWKWVNEGWIELTSEVSELLGPVLCKGLKPKTVR